MIKALEGNFIANSSSGEVAYSYAVIQTFRGGKDNVTLDVFLSNEWIVKSGNSNVINELAGGVFESYSFAPDWLSPANILDQGYAYLRTLPRFSGAEDVE